LSPNRAVQTATSPIAGMLAHLKTASPPHRAARIPRDRSHGACRFRGRPCELPLETRRPDCYRRPPLDHLGDPDDPVLAMWFRFVGQLVAAVVADSEAARPKRAPGFSVHYELLPAVFDAKNAMRPLTPLLPDKGPGEGSQPRFPKSHPISGGANVALRCREGLGQRCSCIKVFYTTHRAFRRSSGNAARWPGATRTACSRPLQHAFAVSSPAASFARSFRSRPPSPCGSANGVGGGFFGATGIDRRLSPLGRAETDARISLELTPRSSSNPTHGVIL